MRGCYRMAGRAFHIAFGGLMYTWLQLSSAADLGQLDKYILPEYGPASVAKTLANGISSAVKAVLIEDNYIDKDYRSTYPLEKETRPHGVQDRLGRAETS